MIGWIIDYGKTIKFDITARQEESKWTGVGFSKSGLMVCILILRKCNITFDHKHILTMTFTALYLTRLCVVKGNLVLPQ